VKNALGMLEPPQTSTHSGSRFDVLKQKVPLQPVKQRLGKQDLEKRSSSSKQGRTTP